MHGYFQRPYWRPLFTLNGLSLCYGQFPNVYFRIKPPSKLLEFSSLGLRQQPPPQLAYLPASRLHFEKTCSHPVLDYQLFAISDHITPLLRTLQQLSMIFPAGLSISAGTVDTWDWITLCWGLGWGTVLCITECLSIFLSLSHTRCPQKPPSCDHQKMSRDKITPF